jgi:hypothetical protein
MSIQQLKQIYRANYAGEHVVTQLTLTDGEWNPETEYIPNAVTNIHTTTQAVAIGNGESRLNFELRHLRDHNRGGLFGVDRLQSYGCNALYRDFTPDFLIVTSDTVAQDIANSGYADSNIVYTTSDITLKYPGKFYLIPQNIQFDAGALAAYMACFDGHKKVFLVGYDQYNGESLVNNVYKDIDGYPLSTDTQNGELFALTLTNVVKTYSDVEFVRVMPLDSYYIDYRLQPLPNFRQIDFRGFVLEADLG